MVSPRKEGFGNDEKAESSDRPLGGDASEEFREIDGSGSSRPQGTTRTAGGLAERLSDVLRGESDGDLFLGRSDVESGVLQWLRALDLQVLGACRADERLRPLLKLNVSTGAAEDRLITQLSQHFEASEVGLLARCLCAPLVSIRVGKVNKQGNLLCPAATSVYVVCAIEPAFRDNSTAMLEYCLRGHLNLTLLPSSKMRISFIGDDGCVERLAVVSNDLDSSDVLIEDISADSSSRSFLVKLPGSQVLYYWCSEKSEIYGKELLAKMKDLLRGKPTLSHLTGISESRLNSFATHLRAYLIGSSNIAEANSSASSNSLLSTASTLESDSQSSSMVSKSFRFRPTTAHMAKMHPFHQGSLSPRSNTFKDGMPRILSSIKSGAREKLKRRGESHLSSLSTINNQEITSLPTCTTDVVFTRQCEDNISSDNGSCSCVPCSLPDVSCLASPLSSFNPLSIYFPPPQVPTPSSLFTPYYCWCPPCPSSLQYTVTPPHLPSVSTESLPLPPLSSLLPAAGPPVSLVQTKMSIDAVELPSTNFPAPFLDPLVRFPLPVSSLVALPNSQQIPTFTPFMSDPIVHIPVIDVCSSGQGYLVSAAPAIPSAIPPLLPIVNPLMPETESLVEKSARETLRMLMASAPTPATPQLMSVLPVVFSSVNENFSCNHVNKLGAVAASSGSCLCNGIPDIDSIASSMSLIELYPLREGVADEGGNSMTTSHEENSVGEKDGDLPKSEV